MDVFYFKQILFLRDLTDDYSFALRYLYQSISIPPFSRMFLNYNTISMFQQFTFLWLFCAGDKVVQLLTTVCSMFFNRRDVAKGLVEQQDSHAMMFRMNDHPFPSKLITLINRFSRIVCVLSLCLVLILY